MGERRPARKANTWRRITQLRIFLESALIQFAVCVRIINSSAGKCKCSLLDLMSFKLNCYNQAAWQPCTICVSILLAHGMTVAQAGCVGHHMRNGALFVDSGEQVRPGTQRVDGHIVASVRVHVDGDTRGKLIVVVSLHHRGGILALHRLRVVEILVTRSVGVA